MARTHVAIVRREAARALVAGIKRIETRLSRHKRAPYGQVSRGDLVHFKLAGGGFIGTSQVLAVQQLENLTPSRLDSLRRLHQRAICASETYWRARRRCRYAVLIWLSRLQAPPAALALPRQFGAGWVVLPKT